MAVAEKKKVAIRTGSSGFIPIRMMEIEIGSPLPTLSAFDEKKDRYYERARCLVRLHSQPLGVVELDFAQEELTPEKYAPQVWQKLHQQINTHLQEDGLQSVSTLTAQGIPSSSTPTCVAERERFLEHAPFASIIIPTHDRPDLLTKCLDSLLSLHY